MISVQDFADKTVHWKCCSSWLQACLEVENWESYWQRQHCWTQTCRVHSVYFSSGGIKPKMAEESCFGCSYAKHASEIILQLSKIDHYCVNKKSLYRVQLVIMLNLLLLESWLNSLSSGTKGDFVQGTSPHNYFWNMQGNIKMFAKSCLITGNNKEAEFNIS